MGSFKQSVTQRVGNGGVWYSLRPFIAWILAGDDGGELFHIVGVADTVITEGVAVIPDFLDDCGGVRHCFCHR